jgi:hypothetical protein
MQQFEHFFAPNSPKNVQFDIRVNRGLFSHLRGLSLGQRSSDQAMGKN